MKIRIKLLLLREIERRNDERIAAFVDRRKRPSGPTKKRPMRNRAKPKK